MAKYATARGRNAYSHRHHDLIGQLSILSYLQTVFSYTGDTKVHVAKQPAVRARAARPSRDLRRSDSPQTLIPGARVEESSHALRRIAAVALPPQLPLLATLGGRPFGHLDPRW